MIYIVNKSNKPDFNIALEEYCFKYLTKFDKVFILWINEPSIIVGKNQNTLAEINENYTKENGIAFLPWFPLATGQLAKEDGPLADIAKKYNWSFIECSSNNEMRLPEDIHEDIYKLVKEKFYN